MFESIGECLHCQSEDHKSKDCSKRKIPRGEPWKTKNEKSNERTTNREIDIENRNSAGKNFGRFEQLELTISDETFEEKKINSFEEAGLDINILKVLKKLKYDKPTPIQKYSLPVIANGRNLMASSQTGLGKTAAFALPILNNIVQRKVRATGQPIQSPEALIIAPTRELAQQIDKDISQFGVFCNVQNRTCLGRLSFDREVKEMTAGTTILTGTPGKISRCLNEGNIDFSKLKYLVLDEADRLLSGDFVGVIGEIMSYIDKDQNVQKLLFSATYSREVMEVVDRHVKNPVKLQVGNSNVNEDINQEIIGVKSAQKQEKLLEIIKADLEKEPKSKILAFVNSKRGATEFTEYLRHRCVNVVNLHSDLDHQDRRQALASFQKGMTNVLVATSLADRGLDISAVTHVVVVDLPQEIDIYIHRLGRTGRTGNQGRATVFFDDYHDEHISKHLCLLLEQSNKEIPECLRKYWDIIP